MLPIFYINLASRPDRREFMDDQLRALGLVGTRIEAVTPADISAEEANLYCNGENPNYLRKNELACTRSHELCWQTMLDMGAERALVFEDDVKISARLPELLNALDTIDAELIRIDALGSTIRVYPVDQTTARGIAIRRFRSTTAGSAGYIINRSAARKFLGHPQLRERAFDLVLYDPFEKPGSDVSRVLTEPALCQQVGSYHDKTAHIGKSNITPDGVQHVYPQRHPIRYWIKRLRTGAKRGFRNAVDHFAEKRNGLERRWILLDSEMNEAFSKTLGNSAPSDNPVASTSEVK